MWMPSQRLYIFRTFLLLFCAFGRQALEVNGDTRDGIFRRCTIHARSEAENGNTPTDELNVSSEDYIVQFTSYKNISDHVAFLIQIAGECDKWSNLARSTLATRFPTDFVVIRVNRELGDSTLKSIQENDGVRSLLKERQIDSRKIFSVEDDDPGGSASVDVGEEVQGHQRQIFAKGLISITKYTGADVLWKRGHTGAGVKVAVFDTGIRKKHSSFRNVRERTDWTDEDTLDDHIGHGTFVAGLIASTHSQCAGFAPDADIYAFRVFNRKQVSFTSWFLDAFNYAMQIGIDVLNLSIGGPDFLDRPFVEKVWEMSANGIIVVSAIGNDGPRYGTLNNPADQLDVIGVGGITYDDALATFSSRGMTTWELPRGYGRVKPDIVSYGKGIRGPTTGGGCRSLSGTSVASPVVAGMVTLLADIAQKDNLNPAMMKQILVYSASPISTSHIFEQGMGKVDLLKAAEMAKNYIPRASAIPSQLDLTKCPYMWPYCTQPVYYSGQPLKINITVLNPLSVSGTIKDPSLVLNTDGFAEDKPLIAVEFSYSDVLWPWSGYLAIALRATKAGRSMSGVVSGRINFDVISDHGERSTVSIPLRVELAPPPPREKRLLWDQFHSLRYPSGYFPRDNLAIKSDILDWNGDHIHTNFNGMYNYLREKGYFVETVGTDWTCVDSTLYGALILVDPEEAYFDEEISKLANDVYNRGLSIIVVSEWHNVPTMKKLKFLDQNTQSWWLPQTGGSNLPQLNRLLKPFHMAFSDRILDADLSIRGQSFKYESGSSIYQFPRGGRLYSVLAKDTVSGYRRYFPVMGIYSTGSQPGNGRVALFGDSNCLDGNHRRGSPCHGMLDALLEFACKNKTDQTVFPSSLKLKAAFQSDFGGLPVPMDGVHFARYSNVMGEGKQPECLSRMSSIPNATDITPPLNHSDFQPHLPSPEGGFYSNANEGLPYFALGLFVGACALGAYVRYCRAFPSSPRELFGLATRPVDTSGRTGISEVPSKFHGHSDHVKWVRGGKLHKRTNGGSASSQVVHDTA
ncbi:hypothetical protein AAMO2058_000940000 [Amorphochlora amoebiformis]